MRQGRQLVALHKTLLVDKELREGASPKVIVEAGGIDKGFGLVD
jgi:hypothetical protein